jgi:D-alanyl-D-alanine carboxypeptidase
MKKLLLLLLLPSFALAQIDSTDIIVKQMMEKQKIIGLSLAVIKNGKAVINKGYGLASPCPTKKDTIVAFIAGIYQ